MTVVIVTRLSEPAGSEGVSSVSGKGSGGGRVDSDVRQGFPGGDAVLEGRSPAN